MKKLVLVFVALLVSFSALAQPKVNPQVPPQYTVRPNNGAVGTAVLGAAVAATAGALRMAWTGVPVVAGATTAGTMAATVGGLAVAGAIVGYLGYKLFVNDEGVVVQRNISMMEKKPNLYHDNVGELQVKWVRPTN
jgi:hypothetical protein